MQILIDGILREATVEEQEKLTSSAIEIENEIKNNNKTQAQELLKQTDWATFSDITTGTLKLSNQTDFIIFRNTVRAIAVNPPTTPAVFPTQPQAAWSN